MNYYNDNDPTTCEWLRELIGAGAIPAGEVDERSILDVSHDDLTGFTQCHFFAGIGGWSEALRIADWPEDVPVWTGSPPCQPFSPAGAQKGQADDRHLAPKFADLIAAARPGVVFGEQVWSAAVVGKTAKRPQRDAGSDPEWAWFDDLSVRLEGSHYAVGAGGVPAAGVSAPCIRQRLFFGAVDTRPAAGGVERPEGDRREQRRPESGERRAVGGCGSGGVGCTGKPGLEGLAGHGDVGDQPGRITAHPPRSATEAGAACRMACSDGGDTGAGRQQPGGEHRLQPVDSGATFRGVGAGEAHSFWSPADWLLCRDGSWRPVEPGSFPLAHGVPGRVGLLRGYGNAINPYAAAAFVEAFIGALRG